MFKGLTDCGIERIEDRSVSEVVSKIKKLALVISQLKFFKNSRKDYKVVPQIKLRVFSNV